MGNPTIDIHAVHTQEATMTAPYGLDGGEPAPITAAAPAVTGSDGAGSALLNAVLLTATSTVVGTARELLAAHSDLDGFCVRCGMAAPCPAARHAAEVCRVAGDQAVTVADD
jgi:hypothetical protein